MPMESARAFMAKLKNDGEFRNQLAQAPSPEHSGKIIKGAGFAFTHAEIRAAAGELSPEELDQVAGGMDIQLHYINESNDAEQSAVVIFQGAPGTVLKGI
jgi:predicted ribosomally synthesized peptide with nif11-like leader